MADALALQQFGELPAADQDDRLPRREFLRARPELGSGDEESLGSALVEHRAIQVANRSRGYRALCRLSWMISLPPRIGSGSIARTSTPPSPERWVVMTSIPIDLNS